MGLVPHRLYGQLMWGLYTKWALSPTRLVFWVVFSRLVRNIGIRARTRSGGPRSGGLERASRDQRGRDQRGSEWWPMEWWPGKSQP
ncbi:hypothetical protein HanXRQr2_Chr05g0196571 [Helianthus annuus]|uniref:Uncharacterized protein n=1 Tax=Helianthus annuus TaxID=4232 RepID=A0A9K3IX80_HELAN|nr:hypothetical protein HanXRQr2_Chr05g0196571 [Helianthus annuus]